MSKVRKLSFVVIGAAGLVAASPAERFYQAVPHSTLDAPTGADPEYRIGSGEPKDTIAAEATKGNELIGYSGFQGPSANKAMIVNEGRRVGAVLAVYFSKYVNTVNAGSIGSATFSRNSAFGFSMPLNQNRFEQAVLYFRPVPHRGFGVQLADLTPEEHARLGTNMGIRVNGVVSGSPAFMADILAGDVLMSINGMQVYSGDTAKAAIHAAYGSDAKVVLQRNGVEVDKTIRLSADGAW